MPGRRTERVIRFINGNLCLFQTNNRCHRYTQFGAHRVPADGSAQNGSDLCPIWIVYFLDRRPAASLPVLFLHIPGDFISQFHNPFYTPFPIQFFPVSRRAWLAICRLLWKGFQDNTGNLPFFLCLPINKNLCHGIFLYQSSSHLQTTSLAYEKIPIRFCVFVYSKPFRLKALSDKANGQRKNALVSNALLFILLNLTASKDL